MSTRDDRPADDQADNTVFLRGRLAADPVARTLPSGDELCSFRLTVTRAAGPGQPVARRQHRLRDDRSTCTALPRPCRAR